MSIKTIQTETVYIIKGLRKKQVFYTNAHNKISLVIIYKKDYHKRIIEAINSGTEGNYKEPTKRNDK